MSGRRDERPAGLTGTLINGYSQGIFYLLYRVSPRLMQIEDKKYTSTKDFNDEYGVTESVFEISGQEYHSNRRTAKRRLRERQLPGVSPLVYSRFLMGNAVFLSLNDMGKQLPEYEEIPVELELPDEVFKEYKRIEDKFVAVMKSRRDIAQRVMSAFMSLLTVYPDQPYDMRPVLDPVAGTELVRPEDTFSPEELNAKDVWLLRKVREKIEKKERVVVYTSWVRIDTQERLERLFRDNGIRAAVLRSTVATAKREEWINTQVKNGIDVLVTNPQLLETGLDLNDFTTLIYYNISYKLFTLRQSSRRSWRVKELLIKSLARISAENFLPHFAKSLGNTSGYSLRFLLHLAKNFLVALHTGFYQQFLNQKAPRIEVYFLYYKDVMQHRAIRLMASKLAVAGIIEGNLTDEGLAAMSECQDLTTLLAQELALGLKNEAGDLGGVFKKMAFLKPEEEKEPVEGECALVETLETGEPEPDERMAEATVAKTEPEADIWESGADSGGSIAAGKLKNPEKKKAAVLENQLSLFEVLGLTA